MNTISQKYCYKCGEVKPIDQFYKHPTAKDGYRGECKACKNKQGEQWYSKNAEKQREKARQWRINNADKKREIDKRWKTENKDRARENQRKWRAKNLDKLREYFREYREKNLSLVQKIRRNWKENNREKKRDSNRKWSANHPGYYQEWKQKNPDVRRANEQNRRSRILGNGGRIAAKEWGELKKKYNYTCLCCGRKEPEIELSLDHVLPISLGGKNVIENAQPLCRSCNSKKNNKHIDYR